MLETNRERDATEPRDNVYPLGGMVDEVIASSIHVDYKSPLGDVFATAAKTSIKQERNLAILGSVEYRRTQESKHEMPSWVPDWRYKTSTQVDLSMRRVDGSAYFIASGGELVHSLLYPAPGKLGLKGFVIAKLTSFSEVRRWLNFGIHPMGRQRFPEQRFSGSQWKEMYNNAANQINFPRSALQAHEHVDRITASVWNKPLDDALNDEEVIEMAYRRTISAELLPRHDSKRLNQRETKEGFPAYTAWGSAGFPEPVPTDVLHEYDIYVTKVMLHRVSKLPFVGGMQSLSGDMSKVTVRHRLLYIPTLESCD